MAETYAPFLLKAPLCWRQEVIPSWRYHWDNQHRDGASYVIIQQTLAGCGIFQNEHGNHEIGPGKAFLAIVPEKSSYYYPKNGSLSWKIRWMNFDGEHSLRLWGDFRKRFGSILPLPEGSPADQRFRELFQAIRDQREAESFHVSELIYGFYLSWWHQLTTPEDIKEPPLRKAENFLRSNYRRQISVQEIADHAGISREHLTRSFQAQHGVGPAVYLRQLRLMTARKMLASAPLSLREVAIRTGFPSARQLSKWMKIEADQ